MAAIGGKSLLRKSDNVDTLVKLLKAFGKKSDYQIDSRKGLGSTQIITVSQKEAHSLRRIGTIVIRENTKVSPAMLRRLIEKLRDSASLDAYLEDFAEKLSHVLSNGQTDSHFMPADADISESKLKSSIDDGKNLNSNIFFIDSNASLVGTFLRNLAQYTKHLFEIQPVATSIIVGFLFFAGTGSVIGFLFGLVILPFGKLIFVGMEDGYG